MSKRFTETNKWDDPWFASLPFKAKLAWDYVLSKCDNAGVWSPNLALADFQIGTKIDWDEFKRALDYRLKIVRGNKWWIPSFIKFQYGRLSPDARVHQSILRILDAHGLVEAYNQWLSDGIAIPSESHSDGIAIPQGQEQGQELIQGQDKRSAVFVKPTPDEVEAYAKEIGYPVNGQAWCDSYEQKGWTVGKSKMKDWKAALRNWKANGWTPSKAMKPKGEYDDAW
jgi:hypothetical protein